VETSCAGTARLAAPLERFFANPRLVMLVAVLLAILHALLAVTATIDKSPTFDEPTHLTSGYSYWLRNDFRFDPENGNLSQRWAALPLLITQPKFLSPENASWVKGLVGESSLKFFYKLGNRADDMLLQGRSMIAVLSGALCLLIFFCSKRLFGSVGGLVSAMVAAFDPNLLAHGAIVTSDLAATFFFIAASWSLWYLLHTITPRQLVLSALSASSLFLAKMSAPLLVIMAAILAVVRIFSREPLEIRIGNFRRSFVKKSEKIVTVFVLGTMIGAVVFVAIWSAFDLRFATLAETGSSRQYLDARWHYVLEGGGATEKAIAFARAHHLLPEAYLFGLAFVHKHSQSRPAYLDNHWSNVGFRSFFPRAFSYKTPLPIFGLLALGAIAAYLRWSLRPLNSTTLEVVRRDLLKLAPITILILVYGAAALTSRLNIGHRHLLPIYPAIFIACGASAYLVSRVRMAGGLIALLLCWQLAESFLIRPHYLAYFNQIAGGAGEGYKHLVDSSLDWGQDLPGLKTWMNQHRGRSSGEEVYLSYFGTADPQWYGIRAINLPEDTRTKMILPLKPGVYCISATNLQRVYAVEQGKWAQSYENAYQSGLAWLRTFQDIGDGTRGASLEIARPELRQERIRIFQELRFARLCAYLRYREPDATAGYSILIYRLTADDLCAALDGLPVELASKIEITAN
jgi:hypothetical protein